MSAMLTLGKLLPWSLTNLCTIIFQTIHFKSSHGSCGSNAQTTFPMATSVAFVPVQGLERDEIQTSFSLGEIFPGV